jgi:hypothetical protein
MQARDLCDLSSMFSRVLHKTVDGLAAAGMSCNDAEKIDVMGRHILRNNKLVHDEWPKNRFIPPWRGREPTAILLRGKRRLPQLHLRQRATPARQHQLGDHL